MTVNGEEIVCTNEHPFYVPVKGWTVACELRAGDRLQLVNGEYVVVEQVQHEIFESPVTVYNFEVADFHTYYVGDTGVLVHNKCTPNKTFKDDALLNEHFLKHGYEFGGAYSTPSEYLDGANYVINNGKYVPEMNGYIKFFGANGGANYAFVGMTSNGANITTFSLRSVASLAQKIWWLVP